MFRILFPGVFSLLVVSAAVYAQPMRDPSTDVEREIRGVAQGGSTIPIDVSRDTETMSAEKEGHSSGPARISVDQPIQPDQYICGPGDVFEINFWGKQNFRLEISGDLEGNAFISKIGYVKIAGKSLTSVRATVRKLVRRDYPGLGFELTLKQPRSFLVHVANNVKSPGAYAANATERVGTVIARAGDVTKSGSRRRIVIRRSGNTIPADLFLYEVTGDTTYNPYVLDGDVVDVDFPELKVAIGGAVRRPGTYELVKTNDLTELVALAGGLSTSVVRSLPIRIIRRNANQQATFKELRFGAGGAAPNEPLVHEDEVWIPGANDMARTILLIGPLEEASPIDQSTASRRLPFVEGDSVRSLIERAGGVKSPGDLRRAYISRPRENEEPLLIPVDLDALLVQRDFSTDKRVQLGDTITIPPMRHGILVQGAVGKPGIYSFNPSFGVPEYVADAGGATRSAKDLDDARVIAPDGKRVHHRRIQPGDVILIPERTFTRPEIVQIVLAGAGLVLSGVAITLAATR